MQNGLRAKVHCFGKEHVCLRDDDCPGDDVFQFSDISWPLVCIEALQGLVCNLGDIAPVLGGVFSEEVASQQHGITAPVAQRGKPQRNDIETVEQILAELPFRDQSGQVLVRGRDDTCRRRQVLMAADAFEASILQDSQKFGLERQRHVADLVEEDGAAGCLLELADVCLEGISESYLFVTEQLTLKKVLRDGRTVDDDERTVLPMAVIVNGLGD